eukprot:5862587-Pyramimonas_sp.AAC.1
MPASAERSRDRALPPPGATPAPGISAEDWERVRLHRERSLAWIRRSDDYIAAVQRPGRPTTPDPRQPEVGRRAWDRATRQFKADLSAFVAEVPRQVPAPWPSLSPGPRGWPLRVATTMLASPYPASTGESGTAMLACGGRGDDPQRAPDRPARSRPPPDTEIEWARLDF